MKITVDMKFCEFHGQCVLAAPDVFELTDEQTLVWDEEPDDSRRDDVEAAMDGCPVQAISLVDE